MIGSDKVMLSVTTLPVTACDVLAAFDAMVIFVILLNLLVMVAYRHDASDAERDAQLVFDYVFTCFYILEAGLLIAAMSWKTYWRNPMNRVDFFVAIAGDPGIRAHSRRIEQGRV